MTRFLPFRAAFLLALLVVMGASLSACASDLPKRTSVPQFKFGGEPPMQLKAAKLIIQDVYTSPGTDPNVEHEYQAKPADIVRGWARDRLRLTGSQGTVTVRILEASVIEQKLNVSKGLKGLVSDEEDREFKGRLRVEITYLSPTGNGRVGAEATATRTLTEHMSLNKVETAYYTLLRELANYFDSAMTAEVQSRLEGL